LGITRPFGTKSRGPPYTYVQKNVHYYSPRISIILVVVLTCSTSR